MLFTRGSEQLDSGLYDTPQLQYSFSNIYIRRDRCKESTTPHPPPTTPPHWLTSTTNHFYFRATAVGLDRAWCVLLLWVCMYVQCGPWILSSASQHTHTHTHRQPTEALPLLAVAPQWMRLDTTAGGWQRRLEQLFLDLTHLNVHLSPPPPLLQPNFDLEHGYMGLQLHRCTSGSAVFVTMSLRITLTVLNEKPAPGDVQSDKKEFKSVGRLDLCK